MNCRQCEHLHDDYPIKVIDKPAKNFLDNELYHFEDGYHCTWNGETSSKIKDLPKKGCRLKGDD